VATRSQSQLCLIATIHPAGEHVDYSGYGVLPMALGRQDTIMAVRAVDGGEQEDNIHLKNVSER